MTKGEANRKCYLDQKKNEDCDCFLCGYEKDCWKNESSVCEDCMVVIDGANYQEGGLNG